jgi:phosphate:Na+ symporter
MDLLPLLAGLGLFMLGMKQLEEALAVLAGVPFRRFLRDHANTPLRGIAVGTAATAVLQSSSLVSLLVLAFVGAGIMQLSGAIGVIMGANLGTTVTGWLVATLGFKLNLSALALAFVGAGGLGATLLPKGSKLREIAGFVVGLGLLLFGLDLMKQGVETFAKQFDVSPFAGWSIFLLALLGVGVTAVIQSSSAAMMIALSALHGGVLDLEAAAAFAIGTGVGTTVTAMLGAIGGSPDKKRVAAAHVSFNVLKACLALLLLYPLLALLARIPALDDPLLRLVAFHSGFNVVGILVALPAAGWGARFLSQRFRGAEQQVNQYLHSTGTEVPEAACEAVRKEVRHALNMAMGLNRYALRLHPPQTTPWLDPEANADGVVRRPYNQRYERLKRLEGELAEFVVALQAHEIPPEIGRELVSQLEATRLSVISAKSVKDIRQNLTELRLAMRGVLDSWLERFEKNAAHFYSALDHLDPGQSTASTIEALTRLRNDMRAARDGVVADLYKAAGRRELDELELSTLFNVNRELYSSAKALLRALNAHLLPPDTASAAEAAAPA